MSNLASRTLNPIPPLSTERFDLKSVVEASALLNASLDLDFILGNLLLVAMSRLLVGRGVVLLANPDGSTFEVAATKGKVGVEKGDTLSILAPADVAENDAVPAVLRDRGIALLLPIRHQQRVTGLVGLGAKATGGSFDPSESAFAQSLVNISAAALHNARVATQLQTLNLDLRARVQELDTLFELSQAFGAALDRDAACKLLGYTLMGQLLVERHAILLRAAGGDAPFEVASCRGAGRDLDDPALVRLRALDTPVRVRGDGDTDANGLADLLEDHGFALALPLRMQDEVRGALLLGPRVTGRAYTLPDVSFLTSLGALALTAIENAALVESRIEKERLEEEMRLARTIQERLLPRGELPTLPGVEVAALALASRHVAGDYYDILRLDEHRLLLAIADVSGKGAPASLLMANLQAGLHLLRQRMDPDAPDLAEATSSLNKVVCENTDPASFITFFWGVLDSRTGVFRFVNGGHNPPYLVRANGEIETLNDGGLLLGVLSDARYDEGEATLRPGDALALYTDGVTEAHSPDDEEYGEERLEAILVGHRQATAPALLAAVRSDVRAFADTAPLFDDVTILMVKMTDDG